MTPALLAPAISQVGSASGLKPLAALARGLVGNEVTGLVGVQVERDLAPVNQPGYHLSCSPQEGDAGTQRLRRVKIAAAQRESQP